MGILIARLSNLNNRLGMMYYHKNVDKSLIIEEIINTNKVVAYWYL